MAAEAWCAAASERGAPSDVTVTFSSSRRFRQAAFGFRFRSGETNRKGRLRFFRSQRTGGMNINSVRLDICSRERYDDITITTSVQMKAQAAIPVTLTSDLLLQTEDDSHGLMQDQ